MEIPYVSRLVSGVRERSFHRNPASPAVLTGPPLEISRASSATPTASSAGVVHSPTLVSNGVHSPHITSASENSSRGSDSPSRTRSMSDLLTDRDRDWDAKARGRASSHSVLPAPEQVSSLDEGNEPSQSMVSRESCVFKFHALRLKTSSFPDDLHGG